MNTQATDEPKKQLNYLVPVIIHERLAEAAKELSISRNAALCRAISEYHIRVCGQKPPATP